MLFLVSEFRSFFFLLLLSSIQLFIYSPAEGHLDFFQFGVIMNKTTINIHIQVFHEHKLLFLLGKYLAVRFLGYTVSIFLTL